MKFRKSFLFVKFFCLFAYRIPDGDIEDAETAVMYCQQPQDLTGVRFPSPALFIANRLEMRRTGNMSKDVLPTALECPRNRFYSPTVADFPRIGQKHLAASN
jgi:hypothetical protein